MFYLTIENKIDFFCNVLSIPDLKIETQGRLVIVIKNSELFLSCSAQTALDYCWFRHPSGMPISFSTITAYLEDNGQEYVYEDTLQKGVCTIKLVTASIDKDSGEWTCNMGSLSSRNEEYTVPITVGVSGTVETCLYHG
jgi:hypothetical protein